jgi:hypothetical protein
MCVDWEERFSKEHPLEAKIKDTDLFLHGTSSKKYSAIQAKRRLLRDVPVRNWGISRIGVCFEKYVKQGQYCGVVDLTIKRYCEVACEKDGSLEGVVLQIKGKELKKLACPIYGDWNKNYPLKHNSEGIPIDVDSEAELLSIIVDRDIPLRYLEVVKRAPFKAP